MTKCCRDVNLKSSVYNQTGQRYIDQLSIHNSMSWHVRRVLLAKAVVDSRNDRYMSSKALKCRSRSCRSKSSDASPTPDIIDRLAYDTQHHPNDILAKCCRGNLGRGVNRNGSSSECPICQLRINQLCTCDLKRNKRPRKSGCMKTTTHMSRKDLENHGIYRKDNKFGKAGSPGQKLLSSARRIISPRRCNCNDDHCSDVYSSDFDCSLGSSYQTSPRFRKRNLPPNEINVMKQLSEQKEEENLYAKFVYDITEEIMRSKIYTDKEMKNVFKKHLNRNINTLDRGKMMYEIYQLKIALNVTSDSTDDEEEAEYVYKNRFSNISSAKPPTPPKILNENKVVEKIISYQESAKDDRQHRSRSRNKSVILVDANPEFLLTERDVLSSLVDSNLEPKQIQHIYKRLSSKSRESRGQGKGSPSTFQDNLNEDSADEIEHALIRNVESSPSSKNFIPNNDTQNTRTGNEMKRSSKKYANKNSVGKHKPNNVGRNDINPSDKKHSRKQKTKSEYKTEDKEIQNSPKTLDHSIEIQEDLTGWSSSKGSEDYASAKTKSPMQDSDEEKNEEIDEEISETSYASSLSHSEKASKTPELSNKDKNTSEYSSVSEDENESIQNSESAKYSEDFSIASQTSKTDSSQSPVQSKKSSSKAKTPPKPKGPVRIISKTVDIENSKDANKASVRICSPNCKRNWKNVGGNPAQCTHSVASTTASSQTERSNKSSDANRSDSENSTSRKR